MSVIVQVNIAPSLPLQFQSDVMCQPSLIVTAGMSESESDQNVTVIVSLPDVASEATGSLFTVVGVRLQVASNSDDCNASDADSVYVNALNVSACLAVVSVMLSIGYTQTLRAAPSSI